MTDNAASTDDVWTVQRILQWTTDFLEERRVESPRLEAELLLAHARDCQRIHLYADYNEPLTNDERTRMREFVRRRAAREPLAYITGRREFYGRDFHVGAGVLIPRPETETLVDVCLELIPDDELATICEIGFGSGCVAVTIALQRKRASLVATDVSENAAKFAAENIATHGVEGRVQLLIGDTFKPVAEAPTEQFDGIVSNPPYVREDELSGLAPEIAQHEPIEALVSGPDGLTVIRRIVANAGAHLKPGGWIAIEIDPAQNAVLEAVFTEAGFIDFSTRVDQFGIPRVVSARKPKGE